MGESCTSQLDRFHLQFGVGIHTLDDVAQLAVVETYKRVKAAYLEKLTLNMLWGLQAALLDLPCAARELPSDIKEELRKRVEQA